MRYLVKRQVHGFRQNHDRLTTKWTEIIERQRFNFCPTHIFLFFFFTLGINDIQGQTTYRKSVSFSGFTPINVDPNQTVPQSNNNIQYYQHPSMPMGATSQDIINQINQQAMQRMGYPPPVVPPSDPTLRHQFIMQQAQLFNQTKQQIQIAEIKALLNEDLPTIHDAEEVQRFQNIKYYRQAFSELLEMQNGKRPFSLKEAVFIIENAYTDNTLDKSDYLKRIKIKVDALKMLMKKEKISETNNLGKNYIIQKLFSERIVEYKDTVVWRVHKAYQYDFDDFLGKSDWSQMFVTKLLKTGKGQCHSMPLLYLIFAEEINAKAWLSLAPEHSFVIFNDGRTFYNYETTNGNLVSYDWLMESGYINSMAIKNRIYLDTLGQDGLMSTLLADLIMGYTDKFGYDNFMASMVDTLLSIYPKSIQGQIFKADLLALETKMNLRKVGNPPIEEIPKYPEAHKSYSAMMKQYDFIDGLGYMQMPKEKYTAWLASLNNEKHKQENQKLKTDIIRNAKTGN
ncbi:MAG: hypothetical protein WC994_11265 [Brumimicrobium sp.]